MLGLQALDLQVWTESFAISGGQTYLRLPSSFFEFAACHVPFEEPRLANQRWPTQGFPSVRRLRSRQTPKAHLPIGASAPLPILR